MFHRIHDDGLAHSSYVIACDRTRHAVVVDPRRDVDAYVDLARQHDLTLSAAVETHVHADFVSGARELSALGVRVIAGPGAGLGFEHREVRDGESVGVGDVDITAMHTPGHTPEHISLLVRIPGDSTRVLTGDTLFVSAVGRPDLMGGEHARALAESLYASIFDRLLALDDDVLVYPAHGAGSLCGTGIGRESHSTIGRERRFNPMLQHGSKDAFVEAVLRDLPETPPYFAELKRVNTVGPEILDLGNGLPPLDKFSADDAALAAAAGAVMIDLRPVDAFADGHPAGAINIGAGDRVGYWAGWVVPIGTPVVLFGTGDARQLEAARRQLLRVGIERIVGCVEGGFAAWRTASRPVAQIGRMSARELHELEARGRAVTIVDVRTRHEFEEGHLRGALHAPVGALAGHGADIPRDRPIVTICEAGYRSSLAASLLTRAGYTQVASVAGGMAAYRALAPTA